jgi:hypothetical protein
MFFILPKDEINLRKSRNQNGGNRKNDEKRLKNNIETTTGKVYSKNTK